MNSSEKRAMVIDSHTRVWPQNFCDWDYATVSEFKRWKQFTIFHLAHLMEVIWKRPIKIVNRTDGQEDAGGAGWRCLWDENLYTKHGGRRMWEGINTSIDLEIRGETAYWKYNGIEYYASIKAYPATLEHLIACMDAAGVDMAALQTAKFLSKYVCRCAQKYPGRLIPLCGVNEEIAYEEEELAKLRMFVQNMGFKGLYWASPYAPWPS